MTQHKDILHIGQTALHPVGWKRISLERARRIEPYSIHTRLLLFMYIASTSCRATSGTSGCCGWLTRTVRRWKQHPVTVTSEPEAEAKAELKVRRARTECP